MTTIHTCHGILSHQGRDSTDYLGDQLATDMQVVDCDYADLHSWQMRSKSRLKRNATRLYRQSKDGEHVLAHSYGAMVVIEAMRMGRRFGQVFLFAPCVDRDVYFPLDGHKHLYVIYNPRDLALLAATFLPFHKGGGLGRYGYSGESPRVTSIKSARNARSWLGHSDPFLPENVFYWAQFVRSKVEA